MSHYTVIECTPGYLPDDDDPPIFTTLHDARAYAAEQARWYREDADAEMPYRVTGNARDGYMIHDPAKMHDLGRVIYVTECDPPDA